MLPWQDYQRSVADLDDKILGKQRIECLQIARGGTRSHPCFDAWKGYELSVCDYGVLACMEWIQRGFKDTTLEKLQAEIDRLTAAKAYPGPPKWWGREDIHDAYKARLVQKRPGHYGPLYPGVAPIDELDWSMLVPGWKRKKR
jgi:hypothetical protein